YRSYGRTGGRGTGFGPMSNLTCDRRRRVRAGRVLPGNPRILGGVKEPNGEELRSTAPPPERKPAPAARPRLRPRHVWKVASTPRMLGFALVIIVAAVACVKLGTWQLDRAVAKAEQRVEAVLEARLEAPPEPL